MMFFIRKFTLGNECIGAVGAVNEHVLPRLGKFHAGVVFVEFVTAPAHTV